MPRKKKLIRLNDVRNVALLQATQAEAASYFKITPAAFRKLLQENPKVKRAWEEGQQNGRLSLRRKQLRLASTNAAMAIHLGKHYLEQEEKVKTEVTGKDGGPLEVLDYSLLSTDERKKLRELLERASKG